MEDDWTEAGFALTLVWTEENLDHVHITNLVISTLLMITERVMKRRTV